MDRSLAEQHLENQLRLYRQALDEAVVERDAVLYRAVAAEKERCAKIADGFLMTETFIGPLYTAGHNGACSHIAAKIRSGE